MLGNKGCRDKFWGCGIQRTPGSVHRAPLCLLLIVQRALTHLLALGQVLVVQLFRAPSQPFLGVCVSPHALAFSKVSFVHSLLIQAL